MLLARSLISRIVADTADFRENTKPKTIADSGTPNRDAKVACTFDARGCAPSRLNTKVAPIARRIFDHRCKRTFATVSSPDADMPSVRATGLLRAGELGVGVIDGPGRREAAFRHSMSTLVSRCAISLVAVRSGAIPTARCSVSCSARRVGSGRMPRALWVEYELPLKWLTVRAKEHSHFSL
jgi:hypothetical protein